MKTGFRSSSAGRRADRRTPLLGTTTRQGRRRPESKSEPWDPLAPSKPRRRIRDAVLWHAALTAYTTNWPPRHRFEGQRLLSVREGLALHQAAMARLETQDLELYRAVHWLGWKDMEESRAALRVSYPTWQAYSLKRTKRISKMRGRFRPPGPEPDLRAVYWRFVRSTSFLIAEVAERQTR